MVNLEKASFTHDELKEALKKFKSEHDDVQDPSVSHTMLLLHGVQSFSVGQTSALTRLGLCPLKACQKS